jgi:putative hemolysin
MTFSTNKGDCMRMSRAVAVVGTILILCGAFQAVAQNAKTKKLSIVDQAKAYCTSTGGLVELRNAVYGTNNPEQDWLWLTGEESFCQYTLSADGSRIHLSLQTLYSSKPTLAALAYYAEVPWNGQGNGNPASFYCTQLGGAEIGATDLNGGGWVSSGGIDQILEACIFPDNSTIDSWGLFYHSDSIIRGIDLSTVLKYANPYAAKK